MKTLLLTATYLVGIGELALAVFFWVTHSKSEIRKVAGFLNFFVAGWVIINAGSGLSYDLESRLTYVFGTLILTTLIYFCSIFPLKKFMVDWRHILLLYFPTAIVIYQILFTKTVMLGFSSIKNASQTITGPLYLMYTAYMVSLALASIVLLIRSVRHSGGFMKQNLIIIFFAVLLDAVIAYIFGIFHFFPNITFNYLIGPIFSALWISAIAYVINRKPA